jgi:phosphate-selective porin OprO and OprP
MRNCIFRKFTPALLTALALTLALPASLPAADQSDELKLLRDQIRALEQKLLVLERKQEIQNERVAITDKGYTLSSADAANSLRVRGLVQLDSRLFFNDGGSAVNNGFVLRRARTIIEGTFNKIYSFQLVPEFGGSSVSILDANLGIAFSKGFQLRAGKFKSPVGLEQLQSDSWALFAERSIVTNLVPNRDLGITAGGELFNGTVNYTIGAFNGVADGANTTNADFDNEKDFVARILVTPFRNRIDSPLQGLSLGVAASLGREKTAMALTSGYRSDGQQTFFRYRTTALADGQSWRVAPQASYYNGSFGALAEYVVSTVNVRPSAAGAKAELQNKAWQLAAGYVLTGEPASYAGVVPANSFNLADNTWGAFEVVARYARLDVDDAAFPLFADPAASATETKSFGLGLNWYLSKAVRATVDYFQTSFHTGGVTPSAAVLRQDEKALITRLQLSF